MTTEWRRIQAEVDARFELMQEQIDRRFADLRYYTSTALTAMNIRLGDMNKFRDQLKDQQAHYIARAEYLDSLAALTAKVDRLDNRVTLNESRDMGRRARRWDGLDV
jgi:hypothetical protein